MGQQRGLRVVAISGSLRRSSSNSALLEAAAALAAPDIKIEIYRGLAELPPFNPDVNDADAHPTVAALRETLAGADAVLISTPEYAHGVPGVLKNALDWVVGSGELVDKPAAVINTSPRAVHAWTSLVETLTVMSAMVIPDAAVTIAIQGTGLDADGIAARFDLAAQIRGALAALVRATRAAVPAR